MKTLFFLITLIFFNILPAYAIGVSPVCEQTIDGRMLLSQTLGELLQNEAIQRVQAEKKPDIYLVDEVFRPSTLSILPIPIQLPIELLQRIATRAYLEEQKAVPLIPPVEKGGQVDLYY